MEEKNWIYVLYERNCAFYLCFIKKKRRKKEGEIKEDEKQKQKTELLF
jgi:hypothetical protein